MAFTRHNENGIVFDTSDLLGEGVCHAFSTRLGGISSGEFKSLNLRFRCRDEEANVRENYRWFCAAAGLCYERAVLSHQLHGDRVLAVTEADAGKGLTRPRDYECVDALITNTPNLPLFVFSADCGISLLYDPVSRSVGAVHSGWRGVALGILPKAVQEMARLYGAKPENIHVAIGAGIGPCCFETDHDVPEAMWAAHGHAIDPYMKRTGKKWHINLAGINRHLLLKNGVLPQHIDLLPHCTACQPEFYWSHRMTGDRRGVQAAVISLKED